MTSAICWYAIQTRSRHEHVVRRELLDRSIEAFLPTIPRWSRWKDRRKRIEWPLFPGYCFARFHAADTVSVRRCAGVVTIVSFDGKPSVIDDDELDAIRRLVGSQLSYDACPPIPEGTMVEVIDGPLQGVVGRLLRLGARMSVVLSVDVIGQAVRVEVVAEHVRPRPTSLQSTR